jgi:hypothetical protein
MERADPRPFQGERRVIPVTPLRTDVVPVMNAVVGRQQQHTLHASVCPPRRRPTAAAHASCLRVRGSPLLRSRVHRGRQRVRQPPDSRRQKLTLTDRVLLPSQWQRQEHTDAQRVLLTSRGGGRSSDVCSQDIGSVGGAPAGCHRLRRSSACTSGYCRTWPWCPLPADRSFEWHRPYGGLRRPGPVDDPEGAGRGPGLGAGRGRRRSGRWRRRRRRGRSGRSPACRAGCPVCSAAAPGR